MKNIIVTPLAAVLFVATSLCAHAQSLVFNQPGYQQSSLFQTASATSGFDVDGAGNVYYLGTSDTESATAYQEQDLLEAPVSNYNSSNTLVDFGSPIYGSFVTLHGSTLYYGDGNNVYTYNNGTMATYSVPGNFDLEFSGNTAYVSANPNYGGNEVFTMATSGPGAGTLTQVLDCDGDFSGPIAFDSAGDLIYGGAGAFYDSNNVYEGGTGGIYEFSESLLTTGTLNLESATVTGSSAGSSAFAVIGNNLYQAFSPAYGAAATLSVYNLNDLAAGPTLIASDPDYSIVGLRAFDGNLFLDVTDEASSSEFIEVSPVPEPSGALLGLGALGLLIAFSRRRTAAGAS